MNYAEDPRSEPPVDRSASRPALWKLILVGLAVVAVVGLILYLIGLSQGRSRVAEVEQELERVEQQWQETEARVAVLEAQNRMLQALGLLYRSALDLEDRNFGTANVRLEEASELLATIPGTVASDALQALRREIADTNLNVAVDVQQQRAQVVRFAERLRSLVPETSIPTEATEQPTS